MIINKGIDHHPIGKGEILSNVSRLLQSIFFHTAFICSRSYAELIFCGDYIPMTGTTVCISWDPPLSLSSFCKLTLRRSLNFLPEGVLSLFLAYPFLMTYNVLSIGLSHLPSRFSCIGS
jgi:hypothetical protein